MSRIQLLIKQSQWKRQQALKDLPVHGPLVIR
jgi:hypothetical protein